MPDMDPLDDEFVRAQPANKASAMLTAVEQFRSTFVDMSEVSVRTLNQETSKVLARVKRGEEITLTERGEVIARIVPASAGTLDPLIRTGRVQPAAPRGPAPRPTIPMRGDLDAGTLLERMRAEERY
jgi:prevent-host-death family protein